MKAHNLKYTVAFFLLLSPFGMFAQQQMENIGRIVACKGVFFAYM
jgi:hypothetical protein